MVPGTGLEPAHQKTLDPKSSASTNSATPATWVKRGVIFCRVQALDFKSEAVTHILWHFRAFLEFDGVKFPAEVGGMG